MKCILIIVISCKNQLVSHILRHIFSPGYPCQARKQDFMWESANEAKLDQTTEMDFYCLIRLLSKVAIHENLKRQSAR